MAYPYFKFCEWTILKYIVKYHSIQKRNCRQKCLSSPAPLACKNIFRFMKIVHDFFENSPKFQNTESCQETTKNFSCKPTKVIFLREFHQNF